MLWRVQCAAKQHQRMHVQLGPEPQAGPLGLQIWHQSKAMSVVCTWARTCGFFGQNQASKSSRKTLPRTFWGLVLPKEAAGPAPCTHHLRKSWTNWSENPQRTSQWPRTSWNNTPVSTRKCLRRAGSGKRILRKCPLLWPRSEPAPATIICRRRCTRCTIAPLRCRGRLGRLAFGKKDGRPQPNLRRRTWMTRITSPPVRRRWSIPTSLHPQKLPHPSSVWKSSSEKLGSACSLCTIPPIQMTLSSRSPSYAFHAEKPIECHFEEGRKVSEIEFNGNKGFPDYIFWIDLPEEKIPKISKAWEEEVWGEALGIHWPRPCRLEKGVLCQALPSFAHGPQSPVSSAPSIVVVGRSEGPWMISWRCFKDFQGFCPKQWWFQLENGDFSGETNNFDSWHDHFPDQHEPFFWAKNSSLGPS